LRRRAPACTSPSFNSAQSALHGVTSPLTTPVGVVLTFFSTKRPPQLLSVGQKVLSLHMQLL